MVVGLSIITVTQRLQIFARSSYIIFIFFTVLLTLPFKDNLFTSAVYWCFSYYLLQLSIFIYVIFYNLWPSFVFFASKDMCYLELWFLWQNIG